MGKYEDLSNILRDFTGNGPSGCACGVAKNGETLYEGYFGLADIESGRPIDENTVYRLFSMTKVVVCAAALILFERGKYLLNEPLYAYFPEYRDTQVYQRTSNGGLEVVPAKSPMLVKHAFCMSVGLPYASEASLSGRAAKRVMEELEATGKYDLRTQIRALSRVPAEFHPGERWLYGYGHDIVAGLIEVVSGMTVGQFLKDEIFDPLGMRSTGYRYTPGVRERMASFYQKTEDGRLVKTEGFLDRLHEPDAVLEGGGAGLYSTVRDYLRFSQMMANDGLLDGARILGRKTIDLMRGNQLNEAQLKDFTNSYLAGYGYGLGVRTMMEPAQGHSNTSVGEFGWTGVGGTWTSIDPSEGFSVVYMHQMTPNMEEYHHLRVRAAAYGCL